MGPKWRLQFLPNLYFVVSAAKTCLLRQSYPLPNKALALLSACFALIILIASPINAEIRSDLRDPYLEREFDWAMFMDTRELKQFLNYSGSKLHPLIKVRITFRSFSRGDTVNYIAAKPYEELWYYRSKPLGLRRYQRLDIQSRYLGAVVVGPVDENIDKTERSNAIANALVRLIVDLQFRDISTAVVLVPKDQYDQIAEGLGRYKFYPDLQISEGRQVSIHMRSTPAYKDEYFYFQK
jgi:hypothetical protein